MKFKPEDQEAIRFFVQNGYVVYEGAHDLESIKQTAQWVLHKYAEHSTDDSTLDVNEWSCMMMDHFIRTDAGEKFIKNQAITKIMQQYLGPDICVFNQDALWVNVPKDTNPVLLKGIHTDAWTGTSVNTLFCKTFFTDVDEHNGMSVCPGSHLLGLVPVKNREVNAHADIDLTVELLNLKDMKSGDVLIWHPLLLHSTTGHSDTNIRVSITSRYTSTETPFTSQERALGYRTLSVGPMNQILRIIGNDQLQPFRTLGGFVGVDKRLKDLYTYSNYS